MELYDQPKSQNSVAIVREQALIFSDAAIRGRVLRSYLAPAMQKHLDDFLREAGLAPEWNDLSHDLDRLAEVSIRHSAPISRCTDSDEAGGGSDLMSVAGRASADRWVMFRLAANQRRRRAIMDENGWRRGPVCRSLRDGRSC